MSRSKLDEFLLAYMEAALWAEVDHDTGHPLDKDFDIQDIAPQTVRLMTSDCKKFMKKAGFVIDTDLRRAGHDFWLTRQRHGAGFWDGDWGDDGDFLTDLAHQFKESVLVVGEDGKIYSD